MKEQQFLKTMIDTVKYGDYNHKDELLGILRNSIIKHKPMASYSTEPGKDQEYIVLRVPIPMLKEAKNLKSELKELASIVYEENDSYAFKDLIINPKAVEINNEEYKKHNVSFDGIKDIIIQGIRNAKYTIWVAVAWFTNNEIFEELMLRKRAGINIRIITSNEPSNQYLMEKLESNFETVKIPLKGPYLSNRLHDKFCIIDFEFVMYGSYNWSKNAEGNDETLATALDRDFVKKFSD